jgi:uncharacterized protein YodC (DUF2158 family)
MTFKEGDVVTLKSGGPKMTVFKIDSVDVWCEWFDGNEHKRDYFTNSVLKIYEQPAVVKLGRR